MHSIARIALASLVGLWLGCSSDGHSSGVTAAGARDAGAVRDPEAVDAAVRESTGASRAASDEARREDGAAGKPPRGSAEKRGDGGVRDAGASQTIDAGAMGVDAGAAPIGDAGTLTLDSGVDAGVDTGAPLDSGGEGPPDGAADGGTDAQPMGDAGGSRPDAALPSSADWTCFGRDLRNSRHADSEAQIDRQSVASLELAWRAEVPGMTGTPAVRAGTVYFADWAGGVHARTLEEGDVLWQTTLPSGVTSSPCVAGDRILLGDGDATVHALDRATGARLWSSAIDDEPLTHLYSSPVVADGVVVVGTAAYGTQENRSALPLEEISNFRGAVVGLDLESGSVLWRFETTRVVGEPDWYGPGVAVWSSAAIDSTRGALFIGTGNGYATPVSPYSDALLAIDYRTGQLVWHHQFTENDAFSSGNAAGGPDYDVGAAPNLFTIEDGGITRDVVGVGDKSGVYRVLDRDSGALVWSQALEPGWLISARKTGGIIAPAAYANGRIFVASNTSSSASKVWALNARTGAIEWVSASIPSVHFGGPAVAGGVLFFGGSGFQVGGEPARGLGVSPAGSLTAFDIDNGAVLRELGLFAGRGGGFAVSGGHVLVGSGFTFFAAADEPLQGALEVFSPAP